ncbi:MAG TPA: ATP-binding protein [Candidatus Limnocylindrales bacterium]|nr:ATP-binding protein [Candidatus Limnocylindrales bacterium]
MSGPRADTAAFHARLEALERQVRAAVDRRRGDDPQPDDPFRGLYVTHDQAINLLDSRAGSGVSSQAAAEAADAADAGRLGDLIAAFGLDDAEVALLVIAVAPDVDPRFERLYGYLNDDVTRRRPTIGLTMELAGLVPGDPSARARLSASGRLVRRGLLVIEDRDRPFLGRSLRSPDRVTAFLLGDDTPDAGVEPLLDASIAPDLRTAPIGLARAIGSGVRLSYLREASGSAPATGAASAIALAGIAFMAIDLQRLPTSTDPTETLAAALLEARLREAVLIAGPLDQILERAPSAIAGLADAGWPMVLYGTRAWEPSWARAVPLQLEAPVLDVDDRSRFWRQALDRRPEAPSNGHLAPLIGATEAFHMTPQQIERAVESGLLLAVSQDRDLSASDLQAGARRQNAAGLERLARRIEPSAGWDDLVVPTDVGRQLHELAGRARQRDRVLGEWKIGGRSNRGRGITALFAGESGTGKTLSAEVIAQELGLDLYVIDLSTVVDKYIGETEKNLDRIFTEADRVNGVLLFDEADAIFGKRSEVRDARDRYANVEVAYLLQRMERFDGLAVLTTNLRANLDESFTRRLDAIIDFPTPDEDARQALWRMHLPAQLPQADDLDLDFLARRFALAGGNIRNICVTAAYFAAEADAPVGMADLIRATGREYQKLGRLTLEAEFGDYHGLLAS